MLVRIIYIPLLLPRLDWIVDFGGIELLDSGVDDFCAEDLLGEEVAGIDLAVASSSGSHPWSFLLEWFSSSKCFATWSERFSISTSLFGSTIVSAPMP